MYANHRIDNGKLCYCCVYEVHKYAATFVFYHTRVLYIKLITAFGTIKNLCDNCGIVLKLESRIYLPIFQEETTTSNKSFPSASGRYIV